MIDRETYERERALVDKAEAAKRANWPDWRKGGACPTAVIEHPDYKAVDNAMRGRVAQYEIVNNTPESFVAYVGKWGGTQAAFGRDLTTWAGDVIGTVTLRTSWRVNSYVGSRMYQAYARVGGREFTGRTFGEGMAVVLRETAASKRARNV
ncbi:hypothetical protein [Thauera sp.]|uniref:hypothetical protein n=1 Tax=Thauera sp. TaxID=1905334 RepID=UPI002CED5E4D|nr:hypothetical protein [Thauera sp.]HRP25356.1 hypothetical protein [Thauera sp.]